MESNDQSPGPSNSNGERVSNIEGASTPEEVLSYHRRYPADGEYVPVILSPGFRFCPEDDELIVDYLNKEINKEHAPYIRIPNVNVYNYTPEELAKSGKSLGKDEWYFFSPRDRKYLNGHRPNRAAGNGYWKATGADKKIYRNGKVVGSKKCLVYYEGKPQNGKKANWIMNEYVTNQPGSQRLPQGADDMRLDDCVLCRIHKKSEYSPKEEKEDAASKSGETAIPAARKSSENKKQAAPKRVKTEHEGTSQHNSLPVQQPNFQVQQPNLLMPQQNQHTIQYSHQPGSYNLGEQLKFRDQSNPEEAHSIMRQPNLSTPQQNPKVPQPTFSMPQQNQHTLQYSHPPRGYNLGEHLEFRQQSNPEEAHTIKRQPNLSTPQQNLEVPHPTLSMPQQNQHTLQFNHHPWSYNLGGQFNFRPESNPEEAQSIFTLQPNNPTPQQNILPTPQQNPQATQDCLQAGSHNLGEQLDFPAESILEEENQFNFDNLGNLTFPPVFHNWFVFEDFCQISSMDLLEPIPPSLDNNDHPQNGHDINAATSGNVHNPRDQSLI